MKILNVGNLTTQHPLTSIVRKKYYQWGPATGWLPTFFKIFSFLFNWRKKLIQVWNNMMAG